MRENQADNGIFERAKQRDILEVARDLGIELKPSGNGTYRGKSLLEAGKNDTCLCVYPESNSWFDFKTDTGGDVTDLVMYASNKSKIESAKWLVGEDDDGKDVHYYSERAIQLKTLENKYKEAHNRLKNDAETLEYLHKRGLTDEFLEAKCWGVADEWRAYDGNGKSIFEKRLQIPYFDRFWRVIYGTSRSLPKHEYINPETGKALKYKQLSIGKNGSYSALYRPLLGLETIPHKHKERKTLVICEGCFDWASFAQEGYSVLGLSGGNIGQENKGEFFEICKSFERIILTFDNDKTAGENFTYNIGEKLLSDGILFDVVRDYGEGVKDVSDYYTAGGKLDDLIKTAQNGLKWLCDKFLANNPYKGSKEMKNNAKRQLKEFFDDYRKTVEDDETEIKAFLTLCRNGDYPEKFLKDITEPEDKSYFFGKMRDEFLDKHRIFSYGDEQGACYYEYKKNSGEWKKTTSGYIKRELSNILEKNSKTGYYKPSDFNATYELIRHKLSEETMPEFNRKPLWRFKNCILNLKTGEKHIPQPEDYISGGMREYEYRPEATCEKFEQFLKDITGNEPSRIKTIWKFIAYIFFPDNRLGQAPLFIGREGSGKSTLLEVIKALVTDIDNTNVTDIQPKSINNPFTRSNLQYSLLNIADDVDKTLGYGISYIKNLITGQAIDVERKFEKNISIRTRTKMFFSCNELPKAETILGFERRLIFVKIVGDFREKKVNLNMLAELKEELSGIFNKAYSLYKEMIINSQPIEPCIDQDELMTEFKTLNNDVLSFIADKFDDLCTQATYKPEEIHQRYLTWCKDLQFKDLKTRKQFMTEFNRLIKKDDIKNVTKNHHKNGDTYSFRKPLLPEAVEPIQAQQKILIEPEAPQEQTLMSDNTQSEKIENKEPTTLRQIDKRTNQLMGLARYFASYDYGEFSSECNRVKGNFEAMKEFTNKMQAKQGDTWKQKLYKELQEKISEIV